jgi:hypothetical protein
MKKILVYISVVLFLGTVSAFHIGDRDTSRSDYVISYCLWGLVLMPTTKY